MTTTRAVVSQRWPARVVAFLAAAAALVALAVSAAASEVQPSTSWGIAYGVAAAVLLALVLAYPLRRRAPRYGPAAAHVWLQVHTYGGVLFLLLVFMHTGFRLPHGALAWSMWLLSAYLVASGLVGRALQLWLARVLTSAFSTEVHQDRVGELVKTIKDRVEALIDACDEPVRRFYMTTLASAMEGPQPRLAYVVDAPGAIRSRMRHFDHLRRITVEAEGAKVNELESLVAAKLEIDAQYTLQRALRSWLHWHVPLSLVLAVLVLFHIFSILYY